MTKLALIGEPEVMYIISMRLQAIRGVNQVVLAIACLCKLLPWLDNLV